MEDETLPALAAQLGLIATATVLATVLTRLLRRGPFEYLPYTATRPARHIKWLGSWVRRPDTDPMVQVPSEPGPDGAVNPVPGDCRH